MKDNMKKFFLILIFSSSLTFSQNYLEEGNTFLSENKFSEAEEIFKDGLKKDPENLILKSQLALSLIEQEKYNSAEIIISEILEKKPLFTAALWYGGINNFSKNKPDFRKAIFYFEKSYDLIDKNSMQYFALNYYIGKSYKNLLYTEGLSYSEVNRMLETLTKYIELQPDAEDKNYIKGFIDKIQKNRPGENVGKWILTNKENVMEVLKKDINER
ncbi:tetratricopeptide repeat protein [uncultured Chryseobacterium sp.]|uniref:tetratricopeptide repeat protein n=1 Tax=uncultured Chryseobacterium sp. TaxID=259322 RepID=UPI0025DF4FCA|nr:tetratricopeptide repeat protein [uncultured Chryseobacterium sp.]